MSFLNEIIEFLHQGYPFKVAIPMKHVYGPFFVLTCVLKMYNIFSKIHEYIMDFIIDVCRQSWGHVWKLRAF